jgi:threonine synthase
MQRAEFRRAHRQPRQRGLACVLARRMGLPIGADRAGQQCQCGAAGLLRRRRLHAGPSIATLANAMDVGAPNNFERLQWLYPDAGGLRALLSADAVDDATIRATIVDAWQRQGEAICPHTACAVHVLQRRRAAGASGDWVAVSTGPVAQLDRAVPS